MPEIIIVSEINVEGDLREERTGCHHLMMIADKAKLSWIRTTGLDGIRVRVVGDFTLEINRNTDTVAVL